MILENCSDVNIRYRGAEMPPVNFLRKISHAIRSVKKGFRGNTVENRFQSGYDGETNAVSKTVCSGLLRPDKQKRGILWHLTEVSYMHWHRN